jgi:hypothetical protein
VNVITDVRVRGRDGRLYPARAATDRERDRAVYLIHRLRCEHLLSIRATAAKLREYGIFRSPGAVARDLKLYRCEGCRQAELEASEPAWMVLLPATHWPAALP